MKSLLFIGPWPPPFGGIASHLYELLPGLEQNGYKINILSFSESKQEINFVERGVHVNYFSPSFYFFKNFLKILFSSLINLSHKKVLILFSHMIMINFT